MTPPDSDLPEPPPIGLHRSSAGRYDGQYRPEFSRVHQDQDLLWVSPLPTRYVVAVVGRRWSGKGAIVTYLQEKRGFAAHNLQRIVRQEAERAGRAASKRAVRQSIADALRSEHMPPNEDDPEVDGDPAYLARRALRRIRDRYSRGDAVDPPRRIVVGGFGHVAELEAFSKLPNFHVLRVQADDEERRARADSLGLLEADLTGYRSADYPGVADVDVDDPQVVFDLIDSYDRDGRSAAPWASECAHGTDRLLERVEEWACGQTGDPADLDQRSCVFDIGGLAAEPLGRTFSRLDAIADALDQRYLIRRP